MTLVADGLDRESRRFSMLEVTLALAIVGVLVAALLPATAGWQESANFKAALNTAAGLAQAVHLAARLGPSAASASCVGSTLTVTF